MNPVQAVTLCVLFSAHAALAAGTCTNTQPQAAEKAAILKVEQLVANAQTPQEGLSTFDDHALQDDFFPPQRHGKAEIMQDFQVYMDNYTSFHADILDMTIDTRCDLAVAYSHQHFTAAGRAGKPRLDAVVRQIDVLHKEAGKWLIVYQHLSVPVDIHTGQAVWKP